MKALLLEDVGGNPVIKTVNMPELIAGNIRICIKAAALNHRDVWIQKGLYPAMKLPMILGSDGAGVVDEIGDGVDSRWVGKNVVINPSFEWGTNSKAQGNDFKILGMPRPGTFAEYIVVPQEQVIEAPEHLNFNQAASLPLAGLTAYRALFTRADLKAEEKVLITGIGGGVALFAMQFASAAGCRVWGTSSSHQKIKSAKKLGLEGGYNYQDESWSIEAFAETGGFDVIIDGAAGKQYGELIDAAAPGGRIVHYGGTAGEPDNLPIRKMFWKQLNILGTTMGTAEDFAHMIHFVSEKQIAPIIDSAIPLSNAADAFARMDSGEQFGKLVLSV